MRKKPPGIGDALVVSSLLAVYCGCVVAAKAIGLVERTVFVQSNA